MNFAVIFHTKDKSCEKINPSEFDFHSLSAASFAWIDFDLDQENDIKEILNNIGIPDSEFRNLLSNESPYNFRHGQNFLLDILPVCSRQEDRIVTSRLLVAMNNRIILTAHQGSSIYIEKILEVYEESFKSVGKTPGFIYFLLWDALVDGFLPQVFYIDEMLELLEETYLHGKETKNILDEIIGTKKMVRSLKQSLSPMQRSMRHLVGAKLDLISDEARMYLTGLFDHMDRLAGTIDSLQDRVHSTLAGYNSILSQQINNSMKVLTIIATIMMPLSLLAAIYGTNFAYIPELGWKYSYFVFLGVLTVIGLGMVILFKKKRWL